MPSFRHLLRGIFGHQHRWRFIRAGISECACGLAKRQSWLTREVSYAAPGGVWWFERSAAERDLAAREDTPDAVCRSQSDGECTWEACPQIRDSEPERTGRHCPLDRRDDDDEI